LLVFAGLGLLVPLAAFKGPETTYDASVKLLVASSTTSGAASYSAETVAGIATAMADHRAALHPDKWVHGVSAQPLGDSGIVELSVIDEDPVVAAAVANSLARQSIDAISKTTEEARQALIDDYNAHIRVVDQELKDLDAQIPADPAEAASQEAQRELLLQNKENLIAQRSQGQTALATSPLPTILEGASAGTAQLMPSSRAQDLAFGALLGLIVGIAVAALAEALNPTLVGREAISAEVQAPILGVLPDLSGAPSDELSWLGWQLAIQAKRTKVTTLELTTAGPEADLAPLSESLTTAIATQRGVPSRRTRRAKATVGGGATGFPQEPGSSSAAPPLPASPPTSNIKVRVLDRANASPVNQNGSAGLVVVTPKVVKRSEIDPAMDILQVTGWPLVGAIAYRKRGIVRSLWRLVHRRSGRHESSREVIDVP
jgi:capsular polysaccharide biosynthesis protein